MTLTLILLMTLTLILPMTLTVTETCFLRIRHDDMTPCDGVTIEDI